MTLIDSLSTLAILAGSPKGESHTGPQALSDFQRGVGEFVKYYGDGREGSTGQGARAYGFDLDSKVQVFETVIRGLGGLLSAHLFAIGELPIAGYTPNMRTNSKEDDPLELPPIHWPNGFVYDGQLLRLAMDLGQRLLPAFYTRTGIPYPRVNLRHGIPFYTKSPLHWTDEEAELILDDHLDRKGRREITETCSAGAASLTLEFTVLSRLSGDARFEQAAKRAFWAVWERRSPIGLIGNGIDAEHGMWIGPHSGIGAGMDSFFEYALKSHILLSGHGAPNGSVAQTTTDGWLDPNTLHLPLPTQLHSADAFLEAWHQAHDSVKRYIYTDRNAYPYYSNNHRATGQPYTMWIDSLGAFYPGLLALAGEVDEAIEANLVYTALWTRYSALPERWSFRGNDIDSGIGWWPGRPEFIESTYYIYRATKDPWYLYVGEMVLRDIKWRCYAPCGWAGLQDVRTGEKQDRMESFFLGETTKYMYLLFDPDHALNKLDAPFVFSTEGHPLIIPKKMTGPTQPKLRASTKELQPYYDETFTHSCPVPPVPDSLTGSATAARPDLFGVSRFTDLYNTPNFHGPLEAVKVEHKKKGRVTKYRPLSNHTLFPWTLPPELLPPDGHCIAPPARVISTIEFPASDSISSVISRFGTSIQWLDHLGDQRGPTIKNLEGLRLQLEKQVLEESGEEVWKIIQVGPTELGQHETVFFYAEDVRHLKDEAFTTHRRVDTVDIEVLLKKVSHEELVATMLAENFNLTLDDISPSDIPQQPEAIPSGSLFKSLLRAVTSVFEPTYTGLPEPKDQYSQGSDHCTFEGRTAVGPGAFPLPNVVDTPIEGSAHYKLGDVDSMFPWKTTYIAGQACDAVLPDDAPRKHHIIVMRRGGCSFSTKINNIPSFPSSKKSLQLVLIVDDTEDGEPTRPLLDEEQLTPAGMRRHNGIPMVLLKVHPGDFEIFEKVSSVGLRRMYHVSSQGLPIHNAVVL